MHLCSHRGTQGCPKMLCLVIRLASVPGPPVNLPRVPEKGRGATVQQVQKAKPTKSRRSGVRVPAREGDGRMLCGAMNQLRSIAKPPQPKYRSTTSICPRFDAQKAARFEAAASNTRLGEPLRTSTYPPLLNNSTQHRVPSVLQNEIVITDKGRAFRAVA